MTPARKSELRSLVSCGLNEPTVTECLQALDERDARLGRILARLDKAPLERALTWVSSDDEDLGTAAHLIVDLTDTIRAARRIT